MKSEGNGDYDGENEEKRKRDSDFQLVAFGEDLNEILAYEESKDHSQLCGKLPVLRCILDRAKTEGRKVLLFTHMLRTLDLLESFCRKEGYSCGRMDGSVPVTQRQRVIDRFSMTTSKQIVLLLSIKATSLGFNIPSASMVVIFEPDWNPSQDLQAQDRAYRIGQTKRTSVYRLISAGSVEELMYDRQIYKHQLSAIALDGQCSTRYFEGVAGMKGQEGELWGLANLFRFNPSDTSVITDRILKRAAKAEKKLAKLAANHQKTAAGFGDLFDPEFAAAGGDDDDEDEGNPFDAQQQHESIAESTSSQLSTSVAVIAAPPPPQPAQMDGIVANSCVMYSVKHTDVLSESKVERDLSEFAAAPLFDRHEAVSRVMFPTAMPTPAPAPIAKTETSAPKELVR